MRRCRSLALLAAAALTLAVAGVAAAEYAPHVAGIRQIDQWAIVNPAEPPWNAIVKVQTNIGDRCTGTLIAPAHRAYSSALPL